MLSLRAVRTVKDVLGWILCASLLVAQQPPPPPPDSTLPDVVFTVTTSLVQVDAVVTDSKGHYITDLTRDDFTVLEDGQPQKVTNLSYIRVAPGTPETTGKEKPVPPSAVSPAAPPRRADIRRTVVLMVDDLGLSFESMAAVRNSLRKFAEQQMQPGDLVAVCRTGSGSGAMQQFTTDKRILLAAIDGLRWNPNGRMGLSFFEPYGKYSQQAEQAGGASLGVRNGSAGAMDPSYDLQRNTAFTVGTLGAVNYIVTALRDLPGRKSIVLFSDGLQLFTPAQGPVMHRGLDTVQDMESNTEIQQALRRLVDRANRAGTVIYTIHAAGLQTLALSAEDRISGMSARQLNTLTLGRDVAFNAAQQGLAYLALETGGLAYENGNVLNWGLARALNDQQGYYLIGFKPSSNTFAEKGGARGYHRITVRVNRPSLRVRSRSGFFGETDEETRPRYATPLDQMRAAMLSPFHSSAVRLRLTALYAEAPKHGAVVRNLLRIDARDLMFSLEGSEQQARVEVLAVATRMGDRPVASVAQMYTVQVPAERFGEGLAQGVLYTLDVPMKKGGAYQIQVAVRDIRTGKMGSASQFLEIPNLKKVRLALTSIILQNGIRPKGTTAWTGMSPVTRQFFRGGELEYFCLVENAGKQPAPAELDSRIRIVRENTDVYTGPAKLVPIEGGGMAVTGLLRLGAKMTPGDYYLEITAANRAKRGKRMASQWTDFQLMP